MKKEKAELIPTISLEHWEWEVVGVYKEKKSEWNLRTLAIKIVWVEYEKTFKISDYKAELLISHFNDNDLFICFEAKKNTGDGDKTIFMKKETIEYLSII